MIMNLTGWVCNRNVNLGKDDDHPWIHRQGFGFNLSNPRFASAPERQGFAVACKGQFFAIGKESHDVTFLTEALYIVTLWVSQDLAVT